MRFRLGPPPTDDTISEERNTWRLLNEPNPLSLQIIGIFTAVLITACIALVVSISVGTRHMLNVSWVRVILFIFLIVPVHAVGFEGGLVSNQVIFGFYPKALSFYAHYNGKIPRNRYVIIAALPFLILTIIPLSIVAVFRPDHTYLTEIIISNGLASAADLLTIIIISLQIPRQSVLINSGMKSYWKPAADKPLKSDSC